MSLPQAVIEAHEDITEIEQSGIDNTIYLEQIVNHEATQIYMNQTGTGNNADVFTLESSGNIMATQYGSGNHLKQEIIHSRFVNAVINQDGNYNETAIKIHGQDNSIHIHSTGNNNKVGGMLGGELIMEGDQISTGIFQQGDFNEIKMTQKGRKQTAIIHQTGNLNRINIQQANASLSEKMNMIQAKQSGNSNHISVDQSSNYSTLLIEQAGSRNSYATEIREHNIHGIISQLGTNNNIIQNVPAQDQQFILQQRGNNNSIIQTGEGNMQGLYNITQQGEGMRLFIDKIKTGF